MVKQFNGNGIFQHGKRANVSEVNNSKIRIRCPFTDETSKRKLINVLRRTSLTDHVSLHFDSGKSLRKYFHPPKQRLTCNNQCDTCKISEKKNHCYCKNVIYKINCLLCDRVYIGETSRCIKTRIKEHLPTKTSAVYNHFLDCHNDTRKQISWSILHFGLHNFKKRMIVEAMHIRKHRHSLMNGCQGYCVDFTV